MALLKRRPFISGKCECKFDWVRKGLAVILNKRTMKKLVLTMLFGLIALAGYSQVRWDVQLGMNFSNMTKADDAKMLPGFKVGLGMDYAFTDVWSLKSGLMFESKGYKVDEEKARPIYMQIPVMAAWKANITDDIKFVVNAGPYFAVGLGGKYKEGNSDIKLFSSDGMNMKRFDLGIQWGIGIELSERYIVNFTGENGFISPFDFPSGYNGDKPKNMTFTIGVGYIF